MERERRTSEENDVTQRIVGTTPKGKKIRVGQYTSGYYYLCFTEGGELPSGLQGKFIRYQDAENAIHTYLASRSNPSPTKRVKRDG